MDLSTDHDLLSHNHVLPTPPPLPFTGPVFWGGDGGMRNATTIEGTGELSPITVNFPVVQFVVLWLGLLPGDLCLQVRSHA